MPDRKEKPDLTEKIAFGLVILAFGIFSATGYMQHTRHDDGFITVVPEKSIVTTSESEDSTSFVGTTVNSTAAAPAADRTVITDEPVYLDINTASAADLQHLYGIGPKLSEAIIRYRSEHGRFNNIEELKCVDGIGERIFDSIKDNVYVVDPIYPDPPADAPTEAPEQPEPTAPEETEPDLESLLPMELNTVDTGTLALLPCVDEETAEKIIALREELGRFSHVYELLIVDGMTESHAAEIIKYVYIEKTEGEEQ